MAAGAFSAGASLLGAGLGFLGDRKQNKLVKKQLKEQKRLNDRQIDISRYIEEYARKAGGLNGDIEDAFGGFVRYNPVTKKYELNLNPQERAVQEASYGEELDRMTKDQDIRRRGLTDFERLRGRSSNEADIALQDMQAFKRGVGRVDPGAVGGQLRADRTRAINAGYDDAERAAQTLQLRTGSSAVGDALASLARDRVRAQAQIGSPELEGLEFAEGINTSRQDQLAGLYGMFGDEARGFYDAAFTPSTYGDAALARLQDRQKFDLSKLDLAMGGSGEAASTIGNAAAGLRQANLGYNQSRIHAPGAKLVGALGNLDWEELGKSLGWG